MAEGAAELLEAMVPLLRIRPEIEDFCRFGGAWASPHEPRGAGWAQFHIVTRGSCVLERPGLGEMTLEAGDILLLPHGDSHVVRSRARGVLRPISSDYRNGVRDKGTPGVEMDTELLCGRLMFDGAEGNPLVAALPDEIVIRTAGEPLMERFRRLLVDIRDELDGGLAGSTMIAADFARAMFVLMLRDHLGRESGGDATLSLLRDRAAARVVLALLSDLARDWTLDDMAAVAVTSRATLVRAFRRLAGVAPGEFLSELRLTVARQRLAGTSDPISRIAVEVGYGSEGALSKAVLRRFGVRPGAMRLTVSGGAAA
ncbi:AraC family transcriptional regulator [Sphingomonas sp. BK345]|uniref:AraC family transcriptional regulator n=1 Tax=Sphingomonas sp. BK345 TaxID=2586980 RepID=UPI001818ECEF|nr:AraC family transcriptional regulator [Sphingomonas sp. BK345]MBB3473544.1 AraC family transcriptional activator of mtrCDE [Sphingomonas sp. BK345]